MLLNEVDSSDGDVINVIEHIDLDKPFKYLGILQTSGLHTDAIVEKVFNECLRGAKIVWSLALSGFKANHTWSVPAVS